MAPPPQWLLGFPTTSFHGHGAKRGLHTVSGAGLFEPIPAVPAGLGAGGEARDLDVVPIFPLKLLLRRDSSSA